MRILIIAGNAHSLVANRGDLIADMLDSAYDLGIDIHPKNRRVRVPGRSQR